MSIVKYVFGELLGDLVYAPVWWYTRGFLRFLRSLKNKLKGFLRALGLGVWIRNLGKPMYGQYDLTSKLISLLMRFVVLVFRLVVFLFYLIWLLILILLWLLAPIIVVWQIVINFARIIGF